MQTTNDFSIFNLFQDSGWIRLLGRRLDRVSLNTGDTSDVPRDVPSDDAFMISK